MKIETLVTYDKKPKLSPVDLKMHYDSTIGWQSIGRVDVDTTREFAMYLLKVCADIKAIETEFNSENN